jgi:SAM-dependent methyltransferase
VSSDPSRAGERPKPEIEPISSPREAGFPDEWYEMAHEHHFWMRARAAIALDLMDSVGMRRADPLDALDIGSGAGQFRAQIEQATSWRVDITDLNLNALRAARPGRGRILYYDVLERASSMVGRYDAVFLFDVIEHVEHARELLAAALAHLRPSGRLVVNVPALPALFSAYDAAQGHLRRYTRGSLRSELALVPSRLESIRYWGLGLVPLLLLRRALLGSKPGAGTMRTGFQPPGRLANGLLWQLARLERALLQRPLLGTSVMAVATRPGS